MNFKKYFTESVSFYQTTRLIQTRSPTIATVSWVLFILVWISFLASIRLDLNKTFKSSCPVRGAVLTKIKGYVTTEDLTDEDLDIDNPDLYRKTWDPTEIVYPVQGGEAETGSFTIVTNLVITPNQTLRTCADRPTSSNVTICHVNADCQKGYWGPDTHGIFTGNCIKNSTGTGISTCEIKGWCPVEPSSRTHLPRNGNNALLEGVKNFTVLFKNTVDFPGCTAEHLTNLKNSTSEYLRNCMYDKEKDPLCPKFRIGDMINWSHTDNATDFDEVAVLGGVFRVRIEWTCDFFFWRAVNESCKVSYKFSRVDDPDAGVSRGWNFRSVTFDGDKRTLNKNYALKILVDLDGEGTKVDFFLFITTLGSTIGFFSVTPLVCDYLVDLFNWLAKKKEWSQDFHEPCDRFENECNSCKVQKTLKNGDDMVLTNLHPGRSFNTNGGSPCDLEKS